jgi:integrase/recombinase XerC
LLVKPTPGVDVGQQGRCEHAAGDPLTRAVARVAGDSLTREWTLKIESLLAGLRSETCAVLLRDWDRSLRAGNHPETTRYNYVLAVSQLATHLGEQLPESGAACDPTLVDSRQVVAFQATVIETRSAGTGLNKHKLLQQFFRWLVAEGEIERSPMSRVPQPKAEQKLVEVISDEETRRILEACQGRGFAEVRDQALVRMFYNTGARLSEIGDLLVSASLVCRGATTGPRRRPRRRRSVVGRGATGWRF